MDRAIKILNDYPYECLIWKNKMSEVKRLTPSLRFCPLIPGANVASGYLLIAIQVFALFAFCVLREIVFLANERGPFSSSGMMHLVFDLPRVSVCSQMPTGYLPVPLQSNS
jgi:hypothetical protein